MQRFNPPAQPSVTPPLRAAYNSFDTQSHQIRRSGLGRFLGDDHDVWEPILRPSKKENEGSCGFSDT
jgi:hypothetical protein